jgi:hypothetical protein
VAFKFSEFSPHHWWALDYFDQVMTRADLGLADAYIDGDFSFTDKNDGLLNLFMVRWLIWAWHQSVNRNAQSQIYICYFSAEFALLINLFFRFLLPAETQIPVSQNWVREGILQLADFAVILLLAISSIALDWAFTFRLFQGLVDAIAIHSFYSICKTFFQACFKAKHSHKGLQEHLSSLWTGIRLYVGLALRLQNLWNEKNSSFKM